MSLYWRFVEWTDRLCNLWIPNNGWNILLQLCVTGLVIGIALIKHFFFYYH